MKIKKFAKCLFIAMLTLASLSSHSNQYFISEMEEHSRAFKKNRNLQKSTLKNFNDETYSACSTFAMMNVGLISTGARLSIETTNSTAFLIAAVTYYEKTKFPDGVPKRVKEMNSRYSSEYTPDLKKTLMKYSYCFDIVQKIVSDAKY